MDDTDSIGRFWILVPEKAPEPEALPPEPEIGPRHALAPAVERWIGIAAIVVMIGLSDALMACTWH